VTSGLKSKDGKVHNALSLHNKKKERKCFKMATFDTKNAELRGSFRRVGGVDKFRGADRCAGARTIRHSKGE
jgi:hypothetical protein